MSNVVETCLKYNLFSWSAQGKLNPSNIVKMEGIYFWDEDGKKYTDMSSQLVNSNLGHGNKQIADAISKQAYSMPYLSPAYSCDVRAEAARKVVEVSGLEGGKVLFTNAGAESNENAIKIAKAYTGKWKIFSTYRSYHGATYGAANLTGEPRRFANEPGIPGFIKFEGPYAYRAPEQLNLKSEKDVTSYYLTLLENQILYEGAQNVAAIFLETVVGSNGILIPPEGYLAGVRELCTKYEILMVCDEVMSGFGRTGKWFAFQNWDVKPDMITFAKGITCGYVPLGGVIVSEKIAKHFDDNKMFCGLTYSAHPVGCAAAVAAMNYYEDEKIFEKVLKTGKVLGDILEELKEKHICIGEVRYIGLFSAIELVKNRETREALVPFTADKEGVMAGIIGKLRAEGFFTYSHENNIIVAPPLIITEEELREAMVIMDKVLDTVDSQLEK